MKRMFELTVPLTNGINSTLSVPSWSGGLGRDRANKRILDEVNTKISNGKTSNDNIKRMEGDQASWAMTCQQLAEENATLSQENENLQTGNQKQAESINLSVAKAAGLSNQPDRETNKPKRRFNCQRVPSSAEKKEIYSVSSSCTGGLSGHDNRQRDSSQNRLQFGRRLHDMGGRFI